MSLEVIDIVNKTNQVIGQATRDHVHQSGLWHRGVHIFLFTPDRQLLVQKRSDQQDKFPGAIDCSVSEHLKPGEDYRKGAIRGLSEELGVEQVPLKRLIQFRMNYGPNDNMISELYEGTIDLKSIKINQHEIEQLVCNTLAEHEEMRKAGDMAFSPWFTQLLRWYTGQPFELHIMNMEGEQGAC